MEYAYVSSLDFVCVFILSYHFYHISARSVLLYARSELNSNVITAFSYTPMKIQKNY